MSGRLTSWIRNGYNTIDVDTSRGYGWQREEDGGSPLVTGIYRLVTKEQKRHRNNV